MPTASILSSITELLTDTIGDYGLYAVSFLMFIDAVLPAASEPVMVYGGAVASGAFAGQDVTLFGTTIESGFPAYLAVATAGTLAYTLGSMFGWWIGAAAGRPFLETHGRWFHLNEKKLDKAEAWFDRYGDWAVFLGRITPVARSFISIPAGVFRMPFGRYTVLTLLGSALWCFPLAGIGWALGANWERFHEAFHFVDYAALALLVAGAAYLTWRYVRRRRARPAAQPELD